MTGSRCPTGSRRWTSSSSGSGPAGRRAGIWVAPFLVGERSPLVREHPDWLIGGADPGTGWGGQQLHCLDATHPGAEAYLREVFGTFRGLGIDYFKIDFIYAGAMDGRRADPSIGGVDAYRAALGIIREAIGPDAYLLGCGAPILPSVGLVDAMRIGPDIAPPLRARGRRPVPALPARGGPEQSLAGVAARPLLGQRRRLPGGRAAGGAARGVGGVRRAPTAGCAAAATGSAGLDDWGLQTTRRLLRPGLVTPFVP